MGYGENIKTARKATGLTQAELAEKCGLATVTVRQYESGKREPRLEQLQAIAKALSVPVAHLLIGPPPLEDDIDDGTTVEIPAGMKFTASLGVRARATTRARISAAVDQMTPEGQGRVADYAEDILPRYRAETAQESTPAPQEEKDTTPPSDAPETPPEGK